MCAHVPHRPEEHGIFPISSEGWQIAHKCLSLAGDMNGLEEGPTTAVSNRIAGHADTSSFYIGSSHCEGVWRRCGGECFTYEATSTNGCGHWVWYVRSLFLSFFFAHVRALQGCVEAPECEWAVRRSVRQTVVRDKQMKALGMAVGREIDPSKSTDSLCDIWCQTRENSPLMVKEFMKQSVKNHTEDKSLLSCRQQFWILFLVLFAIGRDIHYLCLQKTWLMIEIHGITKVAVIPGHISDF